jgi:hypothetical protein
MFRQLTGLSKGSTGAAVQDTGAAKADDGAWKAELEAKLGRKKLLEQDFQLRQKDLSVWAGEVKGFQAGSMQELQGFVDGMEARLKTLVDEQAVLKMMGEDWPEARYDDFLVACKEYE